MFTADMAPKDAGEAVLKAFRGVHGPHFLSTPFMWAKLGQGTTKLDPRLTWPGFTTALDTLKEKFRDSKHIYIVEEGWQYPRNDRPEWRMEVTTEAEEEVDLWAADGEGGNIDADSLSRCEGCTNRYPPELLSGHKSSCEPWLNRGDDAESTDSDSTSDRLDDLRTSATLQKAITSLKKTKTVLPRPQPRVMKNYRAPRPTTTVKQEAGDLALPDPKPNEVIDLLDDSDNDVDVKPNILGLEPRRLTAAELLAQLAQQPGFGVAWAQDQAERLASVDLGTPHIDQTRPSVDVPEPLFFAEDEDDTRSGSMNHEQWNTNAFDSFPQVYEEDLYRDLETHIDWSGGLNKSAIGGDGDASLAARVDDAPEGLPEVEHGANPTTPAKASTSHAVEQPSPPTDTATTAVPVRRKRGRPAKTKEAKGKERAVELPRMTRAGVVRQADDLDQPDRPGHREKRRRIPSQRQDVDNYAMAGRK